MPIIRLLFNTKFQLAIIILLTVGVYANTFGNQLVWDDKTFADWELTASFKSLPQFLKGALPHPHEGDYRLFKGIILTFDKVVFANSLFVFHLQAILIHLSATLLVYFLTKKIFELETINDKRETVLKVSSFQFPFSGLVAFLTAILFGVHPVHVEAVTFIICSTDILGISFLLAAFYFYIRARSEYQYRKKRLAISGLLALLAFASYEITFILPVLVILYDFCFPMKIKESAKERIFRHLYFWGILASYAVFRFGILKLTEKREFLENSFYLTMLAQAKAIWEYIQIIVFPLNLTINHKLPSGISSLHYVDYNAQSYLSQKITDLSFLFSAAVIIGAVAAAIFLYKRLPIVTFCIFWFFASMAIVSNIIPLGNFMTERYLFLASYGWSLLLAYMVSQVVTSKFNLTVKFSALSSYLSVLVMVLAVIGFTTILAFYSVKTYLRNRDWRDSFTLWSYELAKSPDSVLASNNLGNTYKDKGDLARAIQLYERAEAKNSRRLSKVNLNLGDAYWEDGRLEKALEQYQKAIEADKREPLAYYGLGRLYVQQKKTDLAIEAYTKTLDLNSLYYPAYIDLGAILAETGKLDRAIEKFTIAAKIKPEEALPHRNLAGVYKKQGKLDLAIAEYQMALKLDPGNEEIKKQLQETQIRRNIKINQNQQKETEN